MSQSKESPSIVRAKQNFVSKKICSLCVAFILSVQGWKRIVIKFFVIVAKQTARAKNPGCCKHKQNKVWSIRWFSWSGLF